MLPLLVPTCHRQTVTITIIAAEKIIDATFKINQHLRLGGKFLCASWCRDSDPVRHISERRPFLALCCPLHAGPAPDVLRWPGGCSGSRAQRILLNVAWLSISAPVGYWLLFFVDDSISMEKQRGKNQAVK